MKILFIILALLYGPYGLAERIAVYSGTFDPPHNGHQKIAEEMIARGIADKVIVVPDNNTVFKPNKLSFEHRLNMVKLMFKGNPDITFFSESMQRKLVSGEIWNVLNIVRETYPQDELMWVMGRDTFVKYPGFSNSFDNKNFSLVVIERNGGEKIPDSFQGQKIVNVDLAMKETSSTVVRNKLSAGQKPSELSEEVFNYISRHKLYDFNSSIPKASCYNQALDRLLATP